MYKRIKDAGVMYGFKPLTLVLDYLKIKNKGLGLSKIFTVLLLYM